MRDWREAPARGRARVRSVCARALVRLGATFDMAARADFWPVSGCDSCVRWSGPENVTNSAAAARNGQSGICRHRLEDESSMEFYSSRSVGAITSEFLSSKKRSDSPILRFFGSDQEHSGDFAVEFLIPHSMQGNPSKCSLIDSQDPFTLEYAGLSLSIDRRSACSDAVGFQPLFLELWIFATTRPAHANTVRDT